MSAGQALVAGVDSSTQPTKVVLCRAESGEMVGQGSAAHPVGTECDPQEWWAALQRAGEGLLDQAAAIAVAGQQHGMVVLDASGAVIRPALLWNDLRSAPQAAHRPRRCVGWIFRHLVGAVAARRLVRCPRSRRGIAAGNSLGGGRRRDRARSNAGRRDRGQHGCCARTRPAARRGCRVGRDVRNGLRGQRPSNGRCQRSRRRIRRRCRSVPAAGLHRQRGPRARGGDHDGTSLAGLAERALAAEPGPGGITLLPYFDAERTPYRPGATGAISGLTTSNATPENLARAAVEGVLASLADAADLLASCGVGLSRALLIGGGARSTAVRELAPAKVFKKIVPRDGDLAPATSS